MFFRSNKQLYFYKFSQLINSIKMKYVCSICLILVIGLSSKGQLILTKAANAPIPGYSSCIICYDSTTTIPKMSGINKVWNFTSFVNGGNCTPLTYTTASSSPSANLFPSSNLSIKEFSTSFNFWNSQNSFLNHVGNVDTSSGGDKTIYSDPMTWMVWPFKMGDSNSDSYGATRTVSSLTANINGNIEISATGSGTVLMPGGKKYTNCLQVIRTFTRVVASASSTTTLRSNIYEYWSNLYRSPVIAITYGYITATGPVVGYSIDVNNLAEVGIDENELIEKGFIVYPNPVKEKLTIVFKDKTTAEELELFDVSGRSVLKETDSNSLNTSSLSGGIYILKVKNKNSHLQRQVIITE